MQRVQALLARVLIHAALLGAAMPAAAAISCEWSEPGHDPLTVAKVLVIARMDGLSLAEKWAAGAALLRPPIDRPLIWRDSITSPARRMTYGADVLQMGFGRGRVCDITRATWPEFRSEPARAWQIGGGKCLLVADVCGNPAWTPCNVAPASLALQVPEPGALWLALAGLAGVAITRRKGQP